MIQKDDFVFSAHNLQDFVDCPRRFELKYLLKQPWPAILSKPVLEIERKACLGIHFHQIVQQILSGIQAEEILQSIEDRLLAKWITRFLAFFDQVQSISQFPELSAIMTLNGYRILSIMDLVAITDDHRATIYDWKTTQKQPKPSFYLGRIQSQVYPMGLVESLPQIVPGLNLAPDVVEMVYWFPEFPERMIRMNYSRVEHLANQDTIAGLISDISRREPGDFELTQEKNRCKYCMYRSLCDRGEGAGYESEEDTDFSEESSDLLDFDQIDEIPY